MIKLSIIVPIYNVEKYIRACIESIFNQGLSDDDFELILVNDGTPDNSMEKIADIIGEHNNVTIIEQENQGLSVARNNGIKKSVGEYILFVDSDDLLIEKCIYPLITSATRSKADLVVADFLEMDSELISPKEISAKNNFLIKERTGEALFLEDFDPKDCHVWHTLYRREFLLNNNIRFYPGIYYEDIPFTHECYLKAHNCLRAYYPIYIYRKGNSMAITANFNERSGKDFCTTIAMIWELTKGKDLSPKVIMKLKQNVYTSFSVLIYCIAHDIIHKSERKAILKHIKQIAPDMQFKLGFRQRSVNFIYKQMPYSYVNLRFFMLTN